jgi:hypothetical protein
MITLYLDMDGVLANFNKKFSELEIDLPDKKKFRDAVMNHSIFEHLEFMPDAIELLNHVSRLKDVNIEILTSMGTFDETQGHRAMLQKLKWLSDKNIPYKANFVRCKQEKAEYANSQSILIDDSVGCISPFIEAGGHGILHVNSSDSIRMLDSTLMHIRSLEVIDNV